MKCICTKSMHFLIYSISSFIASLNRRDKLTSNVQHCMLERSCKYFNKPNLICLYTVIRFEKQTFTYYPNQPLTEKNNTSQLIMGLTLH